jgi:hypothetical protein
MITHEVLFARTSPDALEERGPITRDQAVLLFRTFPFLTELAARERQPELTVPTITFTDQSTGGALAIWSETAGRFVVWLPSAFALAEDVSDPDAVENCIALFFEGTTVKLRNSSRGSARRTTRVARFNIATQRTPLRGAADLWRQAMKVAFRLVPIWLGMKRSQLRPTAPT